MTYNEEFIYKHIKRHEETLVYVLSVLSNILINGIPGGGGSGFIISGSGAPVAAPANVNAESIYINRDTGTIYTWSIANQAWE
jgi:hypothetical protein